MAPWSRGLLHAVRSPYAYPSLELLLPTGRWTSCTRTMNGGHARCVFDVGDEMKFAIRMLVGAACAVSAIAHASDPIGAAGASRLERRAHSAWSERKICEHLINGEIFARTELLFGLSRPTDRISPRRSFKASSICR